VTEEVVVPSSPPAEPAPRAARGKRRSQLTPQSVVDTVDKLPRNRMSVIDGSTDAQNLEAALAAKRKQTEEIQTRLLAAAAEHPTPADVAKVMGWPPAALEEFLAQNKPFATTRYAAVRRLHAAQSIPELAEADAFLWTDQKRRRLIEKYVDRGDLLEAQESIGCTPSQFNRELRANASFAQMVNDVEKDALGTLKMRALKEGLGGNDKLMAVFLKQLEKEDTENELSKLTDVQLSKRLTSLIDRILKRFRDNEDPKSDPVAKTEQTLNSANSYASSATPAARIPSR
jgi:hypothetical protein